MSLSIVHAVEHFSLGLVAIELAFFSLFLCVGGQPASLIRVFLWVSGTRVPSSFSSLFSMFSALCLVFPPVRVPNGTTLLFLSLSGLISPRILFPTEWGPTGRVPHIIHPGDKHVLDWLRKLVCNVFLARVWMLTPMTFLGRDWCYAAWHPLTSWHASFSVFICKPSTHRGERVIIFNSLLPGKYLPYKPCTLPFGIHREIIFINYKSHLQYCKWRWVFASIIFTWVRLLISSE